MIGTHQTQLRWLSAAVFSDNAAAYGLWPLVIETLSNPGYWFKGKRRIRQNG